MPFNHVPIFCNFSFSENLSTSIESLDDGSTDLAEFDDDPDLMINEDEPEAWSVTVDKKTLKKMTAKNIKKQDHIWGRLIIIPFTGWAKMAQLIL